MLTIKSTLSENRVLSLEQELIEAFSENDVNYLSDKLLLMRLSYGISRADVERMHHAIVETAEQYKQELGEFRKEQH